MKKLYEGASLASGVLFLIIVIGGFIFGIKTHKDKSRHNSKVEEKVEQAKREKDKYYKEKFHNDAEELEYLRKMNDPLWHYYDEETFRFEPIPGKYNGGVPLRPRKDYVR